MNANAKLALQVLIAAREYAQSCSSDLWDFAVDVDGMTNRGVTLNDLRYLMESELIEHRIELTSKGESKRSFGPVDKCLTRGQSCFVITPAGLAAYNAPDVAMDFRKTNPTSDQEIAPGSAADVQGQLDSRKHKPFWDEKRRELTMCGVLVKRFRWPAQNQERVIQAFQEENWPTRIDDPLPPSKDVCPKRRLHDTIKCLNRKQIHPAIKFRGDGTGQGVLIEIQPGKLPKPSK